ncbi:MAG TPA: NnrU family protein [Steroidobacteraceae bacterium]|nr:NnrU family protein [Steroidobacteraceae bacterium]
MANLIAAAVFFLAIHFGVSGTRLRDRLVGVLGERAFRGLFALASLVGLIWMARAYSHAPHVVLWGQLVALKSIALPLVLIAFAFVVIGISTPSPTTAGMESQLTREVQVRGITRITRHPFLWGTALWALVHFAVNGDAASSVLFGSLLLLALAGTASIDAKRRRNYGERWEQFARETSNVPFAAIAAGRNRLGPALREIGIVRPLLALVVFALVFALHGRLFGAPLT